MQAQAQPDPVVWQHFNEVLADFQADDDVRRARGVTAMIELVEELAALRAADGAHGLDWPFASAVLALAQDGTLPVELDGERCLAALSILQGPQRTGATGWCVSLLYGRGDVEGAIGCLELGLEAAQDAYARASLLSDLAQLERRRGRWESGIVALHGALAATEELAGAELAYARGVALGERTQNLLDQGASSRARAALDEEEAWSGGAEVTLLREVAPELAGSLDAGLLRRRVALLLATSRYGDAYRLAHGVLEGAPPGEGGAEQAYLVAMRGLALGELGREADERRDEYFDLAQADLARAAEHPEVTALEGLRIDLARVDVALAARRNAAAAALLEHARARGASIGAGLAELEYGALLAAAEARVALRAGAREDEVVALDGQLRAGFDAFLASWSEARADGDLAYLRSNQRREMVCARMALSIALRAEAGRVEALEDLARVQGFGAFARAASVEPPSVADLREVLLAKRHGILAYVSAPSGGHVFALDAERLEHEALPPGHVLSRACKDLLAALDAPGPDADAAGSEQPAEQRLAAAIDALSTLALPPAVAARVATWEQVSVCGTTWLFDVPFELLRDPASPPDGAVLLGEARAVDSLPSLPIGMLLAGRARPAPEAGLVLVVAEDPGERARSVRSALVPIPATADDLAHLVAPFGGRARIERHVTRPGFDALDLARSGVVHVLAHGIFAPEVDHAGPALVLEPAPDADALALLRPDDVRATRCAGTVLLSACEAARGPSYWGNDLRADLGGAFLAAGATTVVQTGARVRYVDALAFMQRVTAELALGTTPAEAARRARAELGGGSTALTSRARWARFGVLGLGQR